MAKSEIKLEVSFDDVLQKLKDGDENQVIEAIEKRAEDEFFHALFYAPSSPVSASKADEIKDWYDKFKLAMGSKGKKDDRS